MMSAANAYNYNKLRFVPNKLEIVYMFTCNLSN